MEDRELGAELSRRELIARAALGGVALSYLSLPAPVRGAVGKLAPGGVGHGLSDGERHTLRALCDAIVPGSWNGIVEDTLEDGSPAPGADDTKVLEWLELVAGTLPEPIAWVNANYLSYFATDLDTWADWAHAPPANGAPKFWELPLDPSPMPGHRGRQRKIILIQQLLRPRPFAKFEEFILLAKVAFACDFYFELTSPETRVGRAYIGWPLPPGTTPYEDFTYNQQLGDHDERLVTVNAERNLLAMP